MRLYKNASSRVKELVARRILGHLNFSNAVFLRLPVECQSQLLYLAHLLLPSPAWFACPRAGSGWAPTPGRVTGGRFGGVGLVAFRLAGCQVPTPGSLGFWQRRGAA